MIEISCHEKETFEVYLYWTDGLNERRHAKLLEILSCKLEHASEFERIREITSLLSECGIGIVAGATA